MGIMTGRHSRSETLVLLLASVAALASSQAQSCRGTTVDGYVEQLRETVIGLDLD